MDEGGVELWCFLIVIIFGVGGERGWEKGGVGVGGRRRRGSS